MIDVSNETLLDFHQAAAEPVFRNTKRNRPANVATIYRHALYGARAANGERIKLETIRTPSGLRTSREAIQRFINALTDPDAPVVTSSKTRKKAVDRACAELSEELGVAV